MKYYIAAIASAFLFLQTVPAVAQQDAVAADDPPLEEAPLSGDPILPGGSDDPLKGLPVELLGPVETGGGPANPTLELKVPGLNTPPIMNSTSPAIPAPTENTPSSANIPPAAITPPALPEPANLMKPSTTVVPNTGNTGNLPPPALPSQPVIIAPATIPTPAANMGANPATPKPDIKKKEEKKTVKAEESLVPLNPGEPDEGLFEPEPVIKTKESDEIIIQEQGKNSGKVKGKESKKEIISEKKPSTYKTQRLPGVIYKKEYNGDNTHLPKAVYEEDYDNLMFTTAEQGNIEALRSILDMGRNIEMRNQKGETVLMRAVLGGEVEITRLLIARGADVNAIGPHGLTSLHVASFIGSKDIVTVLLEAGADTEIKTDYGKTALDIAISQEQPVIARILEQKAEEIRIAKVKENEQRIQRGIEQQKKEFELQEKAEEKPPVLLKEKLYGKEKAPDKEVAVPESAKPAEKAKEATSDTKEKIKKSFSDFLKNLMSSEKTLIEKEKKTDAPPLLPPGVLPSPGALPPPPGAEKPATAPSSLKEEKPKVPTLPGMLDEPEDLPLSAPQPTAGQTTKPADNAATSAVKEEVKPQTAAPVLMEVPGSSPQVPPSLEIPAAIPAPATAPAISSQVAPPASVKPEDTKSNIPQSLFSNTQKAPAIEKSQTNIGLPPELLAPPIDAVKAPPPPVPAP